MKDLVCFAKPFKVYVDGVELERVTAIQVTRNLAADDDPQQNKATLYYDDVNGGSRALTVGLEAVSFGSTE